MENNFCKVCGSELKAGERFCSNCGTLVNSQIDSTQFEAQPVYQQPTYQQPTYQQPAAQQYTVEQPKRTTAFKGLYIPAKILGIVSLINSISNIIMIFCIAILLYVAPYSSGIGDVFFFTAYSTYMFIVTFITAVTSLIMSIISISLGGKIKRQDPNDPGANVARPAKVALVFSIIVLVLLVFLFITRFATRLRYFL